MSFGSLVISNDGVKGQSADHQSSTQILSSSETVVPSNPSVPSCPSRYKIGTVESCTESENSPKFLKEYRCQGYKCSGHLWTEMHIRRVLCDKGLSISWRVFSWVGLLKHDKTVYSVMRIFLSSHLIMITNNWVLSSQQAGSDYWMLEIASPILI